jgi:hypothetical protein
MGSSGLVVFRKTSDTQKYAVQAIRLATKGLRSWAGTTATPIALPGADLPKIRCSIRTVKGRNLSLLFDEDAHAG